MVVVEIFLPQVATDAGGEVLEMDRYLSSLQKWLFHFSLLTNFSCVSGILMWLTVCLGQKNKASGMQLKPRLAQLGN